MSERRDELTTEDGSAEEAGEQAEAAAVSTPAEDESAVPASEGGESKSE